MKRSSKRRRLTQACDCCRRMKVKCDTDKPACATCRRLNTTCTFLTESKKRGPRQNINSPKDSYKGCFSQQFSRFNGEESMEVLNSNLAQSNSNFESNHRTEYPQPEYLPDTSTLFIQEPSVLGMQCQSVGLMAEKFNNLSVLTEYGVYTKNHEESQGFESIDQSIHSSLDSLAASSEIQQLIEYYFSNIHHRYPFVHPREFREKYQAGRASFALTNSICAVASRYRASTVGETDDPSYAQAVEGQLLCLLDEPSLESNQAMLHMCIYELSCGRINRACTFSAIAVRIAQGLGFFRLDETYTSAKDLSVNQWISRETGRRVWWFSYVLDTYVSITITRPSLINEDDCSLMVPCIDHYWEDGQPIDTAICGFNLELSKQVVSIVKAPNTGLLAVHIALVTIMASTNRGIMRFGTLTPSQKDYIFPQIKYALGTWEASVPSQYKYRPEESIKGNPSLFAQIAFLHSMRHAMDIWIHLPVFGEKLTPNAPDITETVKRCFISAKMIAFAVQEVKTVPIIEIDPMYSVCIFMAARFFLQGCKSRDMSQAQRSLKFYKFLQNVLMEWQMLWGVIDIHSSCLGECYSQINMEWRMVNNDGGYHHLNLDKTAISDLGNLGSESVRSSIHQQPREVGLSILCERFGQEHRDIRDSENTMAQVLTQKEAPQLDDNYDLYSKTLDELYPSIWTSLLCSRENKGESPHQCTQLHSNFPSSFPAVTEDKVSYMCFPANSASTNTLETTQLGPAFQPDRAQLS